MNRRGVFSSMALSLAAVAALAAAPAEAEARDRVYWSVDVAAPGVATTVGNYRPAPYSRSTTRPLRWSCIRRLRSCNIPRR